MQRMRIKIPSEISTTQFGSMAERGIRNSCYIHTDSDNRTIYRNEKRFCIYLSLIKPELSKGYSMRSYFLRFCADLII